ncbi:MAG: hypothetical protein REI78_05430 [Pedobacter sp.]|nr:hypothetical protein [Pedobacter sp.]MDQ8052442.1 hypothetical protein [Pedobacter sp.]
MYKVNKLLLKATLFAIFFLSFTAVQAQVGHRVFTFKAGDEYETEMITNSNAVLKRGNQVLNINSTTNATKAYKVATANAEETNLTVEIKSMDNMIEALGEKLHFNSANKVDSSSTILRALDFMVKKPVKVALDKYAVIKTSTDYRAELATDTLVSFAGLKPEFFEKGTLFSLLADISYNKNIQKGFTWGDTVEMDKQKLVSKWTIESMTEKNTVVKFSTTITGKLVNSSSNGTYVVDNATGLVVEKLVYSVSVGYQISAGNTVYAVSRSTSIAERTRKVK